MGSGSSELFICFPNIEGGTFTEKWVFSKHFLAFSITYNSTSASYRLGYHEVRIRASPFLQTAKELSPLFLNNGYCFLFNPPSLFVSLGSCYWSHHLRNLVSPYFCSASVKSLYIGIPATYSDIVAYRLLKYSLIVQSPVISNAAYP